MKVSKLYKVLSALYVLLFLVQFGNAADRIDRLYKSCIINYEKGRKSTALRCFKKIPKSSVYYPHALAYKVQIKLSRGESVDRYINELIKYKDYALVQNVIAQLMSEYYPYDLDKAYKLALHFDHLSMKYPGYYLRLRADIFKAVGDYKRLRETEKIISTKYAYSKPALKILKKNIHRLSDREIERVVQLLYRKRKIKDAIDIARYIRNKNKRYYYIIKGYAMRRKINAGEMLSSYIKPSSIYYGKALYELSKRVRDSKKIRYIKILRRLGHTKYQSLIALRILKRRHAASLSSYNLAKLRRIENIARYITHPDYVGEKYWYLGLKAYRLKDFELAARYFLKSAKALEASKAPNKDPSKAYYWLYVTYKYIDKDIAKYYLYKAASFNNPESFYALRAKKLINVKKTVLDVKQPLPRVKLSKSDRKLFLMLKLKHIGVYMDAYKEARYHFESSERLPKKLALMEKFKLHKVFPEITARNFYRKYKQNKKVYKYYLGYSYPKPFDYITEEDIVYAIMRQESFFDTYAVSRAGARGLMQIMPKTGKWIAKTLGFPNFRINDLFVPEINIKFGRFYIHHLLKKYKGNYIYAIAAYNAGPGNVKKFLKRYHVRDDAEFVEFFPLSETRNYVKRVYINYIFYSE